MTRRRFIQDRVTLEFHEVTADYEPDAARTDAALWGDRHYAGQRTTDGVDISTRTKHREYMKRHNLTTVDDYGAGHWQKAAEQRERIASGVDPQRKHEIARVIAQLDGKRR
jgi:hypothetical protein